MGWDRLYYLLITKDGHAGTTSNCLRDVTAVVAYGSMELSHHLGIWADAFFSWLALTRVMESKQQGIRRRFSQLQRCARVHETPPYVLCHAVLNSLRRSLCFRVPGPEKRGLALWAWSRTAMLSRAAISMNCSRCECSHQGDPFQDLFPIHFHMSLRCAASRSRSLKVWSNCNVQISPVQNSGDLLAWRSWPVSGCNIILILLSAPTCSDPTLIYPSNKQILPSRSRWLWHIGLRFQLNFHIRWAIIRFLWV